MKNNPISEGKSFYAIGLSYKKADAKIRGAFSLHTAQSSALLKDAKALGVRYLLVNATCNRTEIYGFVNDPELLISLLCRHSGGDFQTFNKVGYILKDAQAVDHIFHVGTGLDSQILGDFEIIAQLKQSFARSKKFGVTNPFLERLLNAVIQASKRIKTETEISSGATSVSFASVRYILDNVPDVSNKKVVLFGMGKIGRNTCENLVKHTQNKQITLVNRTLKNAEQIAGKFQLLVQPLSELPAEIRTADVLVVATGASRPTVTKELIYNNKPLLILDLSIPKNVDENVCELPNITLVHLDHLSKMTDETLEKRKKHIPQAKKIIAEVRAEFDQWLVTRKYAPTVKALKEKLKDIQQAEWEMRRKKGFNLEEEEALKISNLLIKKITNHVASHLSSAPQNLALVKELFQLDIHE